ncbi:MAG: hypothetical protein HW373_160, partial [Deltaproteobacteria bacterium]|nr:hypothetical protein [Deltaproteobacteria bacterium]
LGDLGHGVQGRISEYVGGRFGKVETHRDDAYG